MAKNSHRSLLTDIWKCFSFSGRNYATVPEGKNRACILVFVMFKHQIRSIRANERRGCLCLSENNFHLLLNKDSDFLFESAAVL